MSTSKLSNPGSPELIHEEEPIAGLAALRVDRQPPQDLWPAIAARLQAAPNAAAVPTAPVPVRQHPTAPQRPMLRRRPRWPAALAASFCVASLVGLLVPQLSSQLRNGMQSALAGFSAQQLQRIDHTPLPATGVEVASTENIGIGADDPEADPVAEHGTASSSALRFPTLRTEADQWPVHDTGFVRVAYQQPHARPQRRQNQVLSAAEVQSGLNEFTRAGDGQRPLLKANLRMMRQAEREVLRALKADPDSESLQDLLDHIRDQRQSVETLLQLAAKD